MVSKLRAERIGERIREELSQMLLMEVSDPRLGGLSVTGVEVDRELAFATVYISAIEGSERWPEASDGLEHASNFLRHELAQRIELRVFPRLRFRWDPTFEQAEHIEKLFAQIHEEERQRQQNNPTEQEQADGDSPKEEDQAGG